MKTKANLKRLLVVAGMFFVFVFSLKAENNENVRIIMMSQKRAMLLVSNPEKQKATLNIIEITTDQNLYSGRITKDLAYRVIFDLSNLPDGKYKFKVDFNNKTFEKEIALAGDESNII
ncbi:MAG TPA: hypothetical protein VJ346_08650 [Bacteroidales bacterium]|nr:hypothetical protein [Bacteroidales bacterium]